MFKKIEIRNFRAIRELDIEDLGRVNLFLGENNCSKTSILESIFLLTGCTNPKLILDIHAFRDLSFGGKDNLSFIFHDFDYKNTIKIKAITGEEKEYRELEIKPVTSINSEFQQSQIDLKKETSYHSSRNSPSVNELSLKVEIKARHTPKRTINGKIKFLSNETYDVFQPDFQDELKGVYVTPQIILPENLQQELGEQIVNKQHQELIKILKIIDPRIEDISFVKQMVYVDIGLTQLIPLGLFGDGIRRLLSIILSISNSKNGIILIDELENGLHHSALAQTWKAIIELANNYNVQLFITTHNIETLKSLQAVLSNDEMQEFQGDIRSYTIRSLEEKHKAYKYDFEDFEHAVLQEIEIR